jgi:FG-GAP-like repeat/IPT/TIG domain
MSSVRLVVLSILFFCCALGAQTNPVPFISQPLVPDSAMPGGRAFALTLNGAGFVSGSLVEWNGKALSTKFVRSTQLVAQVPASKIAESHTANLTVVNPAPGGGISNLVFFPVHAPVRSLHLTESSLPQASFPLVVGDFNRDGKLDFGSQVFGDSGLSVYLGNGNGTFQNATFFGQKVTYDIVTADFNHDGIPDIAEISGNGVEVLFGNGDGTFSNGIDSVVNSAVGFSIAAGDFNGDGNLDLAMAGVWEKDSTLTILLGKGDGTFQTPTTISLGQGQGANFIIATDFNNDGKLDLAMTNDSGSAWELDILLGNGDGTFRLLKPIVRGHSPIISAAADFNGDGNVDLAISPGNSKLFILLGHGDGTFASPVAYKLPAKGLSIEVGDFNVDGMLDIALVTNTYPNPASWISVLRGNGDGTFRPVENHKTTLTYGGALAVGDFNNDGKLDFLTASSPDVAGGFLYLQH